MKVCYFGTYRREYSRNQIMISGLRLSGVEVIECHQALWTESSSGIDERVEAVGGGWFNLAFFLRIVRVYLLLIRDFWRIPARDYDVIVVGYPGQLDVFLARLLSWMRGKPFAWDVFMSIYLIANERGLEQKSKFSVQLLKWIEGRALKLPDLLLQDTQDYVDWLVKTHGVEAGRFRLVPTGADDRAYQPAQNTLDAPGAPGERQAIYFGTFIPNHGVLYMIEAARLVAAKSDLVFEFIGDGPERQAAEDLAKQYSLNNVRFPGWMDKQQLARAAAGSLLCLGAFGKTPQSLMTIQNKIYEGMAMGLAVLSGDSMAVRSTFTHLKEIYLCDRDDPQSLAEGIFRLQADDSLRQAIAAAGHALFLDKFSVRRLGGLFRSHLDELLK